MIIGLLDPVLFLPRDSKSVQRELDLIIQICKKHAITLVPLSEYWDELWSKLARPLEKQLTPEARRSLTELRKLGIQSQNIAIPPLQIRAGKVWRRGFLQLFGNATYFQDSWEERMMCAALQALSSQHDAVLLTRKVFGRNAYQHASDGSVLDEITRWALYIQPKGLGPQRILCVYHPRNLREKWTVRFDWRLPTASDGASYPFCPPEKWWQAGTPSYRTIRSKPAWIDELDNGWARPNIPGGAGYHWDVFIGSSQLQDTIGLDQINVVEFGAPMTEGKAGEIHHVPQEKQGKLTDKGWTCKRRSPPPKLAGTMRLRGDEDSLLEPVIPEQEWDVLR